MLNKFLVRKFSFKNISSNIELSVGRSTKALCNFSFFVTSSNVSDVVYIPSDLNILFHSLNKHHLVKDLSQSKILSNV